MTSDVNAEESASLARIFKELKTAVASRSLSLPNLTDTMKILKSRQEVPKRQGPATKAKLEGRATALKSYFDRLMAFQAGVDGPSVETPASVSS